jgi:hypothetical protein
MTITNILLQIIGAAVATYTIVRVSIGAYICGCHKQRPAQHGISSRESVIETMEEENT